MTTTAEEITQLKAKIANLEQREQNENNVNTKNGLNQRIIESTKTLNLLLAQQGTFLFPDLSRRLCVSFLSRSRSMKGRPSCCLFFKKIILLFTFCFCRSIFSLFQCITLHPNHISNSVAIWKAQQVRVCCGFLSVIPAC